MSERRIFVTSDTHFGQESAIQYFNRPFANAKQMDECITDNWNSVVRPIDIVYHLGDVAFTKSGKEIVKNLNGRKRLILGNHDDGRDKILQSLFQKIMLWRIFSEYMIILSHVPLHPNQLDREQGQFVNVHGHIHNNHVMNEHIDSGYDPRYINVCVEHTGYKPVDIESLIKW